MREEAFAAFLESERLFGRSREQISSLRKAYEQRLFKGYWQKMLEFWLAEGKEKNTPLFYFAVFSARAGEPDAAFYWLEKSYAEREPYLVNLKADFSFDSVRSDPRFADLLNRVGLTE